MPSNENLPNLKQPNHFTRVCRVHFSAAHRYFNPHWNEAKNKKVYGELYSPHGHGHNFVLEAHFKGPQNTETGMMAHPDELQELLLQVISSLDHCHLNSDHPDFRDVIPTTENIAKYCGLKLLEVIKGKEHRLILVKLFETSENWLEWCPSDLEGH